MATVRERCIYNVARDLARHDLAFNHNDLPTQERLDAWHKAALARQAEAVAKINAMTNVELLDVIAEELEQEGDR